MAKALSYLVAQEWSMGNGQCPSCQGICPGEKFARYAHSAKGHTAECPLAGSIDELGGKAVRVGDIPDDDSSPGRQSWLRLVAQIEADFVDALFSPRSP